MTGERGIIRSDVFEEGGLSWVKVTVNGEWVYCPVHTKSVEEAERIKTQVREMAEAVYRLGYRAGFSACGKTIRDAIGV